MIQDGVCRTGSPARRGKIRFSMVLGGLGVLGACLAARYFWEAKPASAQAPWQFAMQSTPVDTAVQPVRLSATPASAGGLAGPAGASAAAFTPATDVHKPIPQAVAIINGREISREELGRECILHHGKEVLDSMVNKQLIVEECLRQRIVITEADVDAEISRLARHFGLPVDQWLKLLQQERHLSPEQYAADIIWPTLALRHLAGSRLTVTRDELARYFQMNYGEKVGARLIACTSRRQADKVQAEAAAHPEQFSKLAKKYSEDANSASLGGLVQPICRYNPCKDIEQTAFQMADGEVSKVIPVAGQFVILKRERLVKAKDVRLEEVGPKLEEILREKKMRTVAGVVFDELKKRSAVEIVLSDPARQRQLPGVAALVNGSQITVRQLAEECIARRGPEVLEGMIGRKLIEQACKQQNVAVSPQDLDEELARVASLGIRSLPDGSPDVQGFLKLVAEKQGVSAEVYRHDSVWPSVALKKLVQGKIKVTEEDMQKGYENNYGPRVRCRAIMLDNFRRAQQVWDLARQHLTAEDFGRLAAEYSIEGSSRSMDGVVPPIPKHSGQPDLEKEAFALKAGEMSGVIQVEDKYVILFCEGYTTPVKVEMAKIRDLLYEDIRQKKERLEMAAFFENLQQTATIDNFLAGKSQSPADRDGGDPAGLRLPTLREVPRRGNG